MVLENRLTCTQPSIGFAQGESKIVKEHKYYLLPCETCGKLRYVEMSHGVPTYKICRSCATTKRLLGHVTSAETKSKISASLMGHVGAKGMLGKHVTEGAKAKRKQTMSTRTYKPNWNKGNHYTEEKLKLMSEITKKMWRDRPELKENMSQKTKEWIANNGHPMKGKHQSKESIDKMVKAKLGSHVSEEVRARLKESHSGDEFRKKQSEKMKLIHADPNSVYNSVEYRAKMPAIRKASWTKTNSRQRDPEVMRKRVDRLMGYAKTKELCNYNKQEQKLDKIIQRVIPNQYGYNGGTQLGFRIHHHTPDWVNTNGQKKLINFNGCVWHCCPECGITRHPVHKPFEEVRARDRQVVIDAGKLGYKVLFIWEHEFKDEAKLIKKLVEFNNE